jgi:hypothetical protein
MLALFVIVLSAGALLAGLRATRTSLKVRRWPVVAGRVVDKGVGAATTTGASRAGRYVEPWAKYTYVVEGKRYTCARIAPTRRAYDADTARRVTDRIPDDVDVHYDPGDPGDAYLQPSSVAVGVGLLVAGGVGALVGVGWLYASFIAG